MIEGRLSNIKLIYKLVVRLAIALIPTLAC